jgi:hypothetical protein
MAETVSAAIQAYLTVTQVLGTPAGSLSDATVIHSLFNQTVDLNAGTDPAVTKTAAFEFALAQGVGTINLAALVGTNGATVDGTGLKVQGVLLVNPATNDNDITIVPGAANGIDLMGASSSITLHPGGFCLYYGADGTPDIASGDRTLDVSGTGSQVLDVILVMG